MYPVFALVLGLVLAGLPLEAVAQEPVDLQLVLSVDASGSVDEDEYRLQLGGIAAGFRDAEVQRAISDGTLGRIAVSLVVWADALTCHLIWRAGLPHGCRGDRYRGRARLEHSQTRTKWLRQRQSGCRCFRRWPRDDPPRLYGAD